MNKLFKSVKNYFSLVKFSHTVFAMPFALIGYSLAVSEPEYNFSLKLLLLIILCMVFARNAAMGFNRLADRKFDALNPRTKNREIPSGIIGSRAAAAICNYQCCTFHRYNIIHQPSYFLSFTCCSSDYPGIQPDKKIYFSVPFYSWTWTKPGSNRCIYFSNRKVQHCSPYLFIYCTYMGKRI